MRQSVRRKRGLDVTNRTKALALLATGMIATTVLTTGAPAQQQQGHSTPDQIVCQMSGVCGGDTAAQDGGIAIGQEKSFSLVKPGTLAASPNASAPHAAPAAQHASAKAARRAVPKARTGAGRMEMLVTFPLGSADLNDASRQELKSFATAMTAPSMADLHFAIEGHTDAIGNRAYNLDLSKRRADAVVNYLTTQGIGADRLKAQGFGFDKPRPGFAPRAPGNRRVEFVKLG